MSDFVGASICSEPFSVFESTKTSNNAHEQEVNDLCEILKLERNKYLQYKTISDTLEECVNDSSALNHTLKTKVADILLSSSTTQSLSLDDCKACNSTSTLFGFCDINSQELSYTERSELQEVLKLKLDKKYKGICNDFRKTTNGDVEKALETVETLTLLEMSPDDKVLMEYKNKLISEQEQYIKNLLSLLDLLNKISNLRLKKLPDVMKQKVNECQVQEKMNHLKSLLMQEKVRVDVFTETSSSLTAYKELIKDVKEQQNECRREIQELKELKEKYNQVSCKQYDEILKSYLQYKSSIEKKKLLYDCLKS